MESTSSSDDEQVPVAPPPKKMARVAPVQPTFDDSDESDESDAKPAKPAKPTKPAKPAKPASAPKAAPRLVFASESTYTSTVARIEDLDLRVHVVCLSLAMRRKVNGRDVNYPNEYNGGIPCATLDVHEDSKTWDPGYNELEGMAVAAWDVARLFEADPSGSAVVVVSKHGGDAARSLCGMAGQVLRRQVDKATAASIVGSQLVMPSKGGGWRPMVTAFRKSSEIASRSAVHEFLHR